MNSDKRTARTWGVLLIAGIVFGVLNTVPALEYPDYLAKLSALRTHVLVAVFFQAAMAVAYVWVAALLYPVIRTYSEGLAIGYFGFRIIGAAFLFVGIASLLLLLSLSESFVTAGQLNLLYFHTTGELLRTGRDLMNHVGMILPWSLGGLIVYYCLFKMTLVPQWLSVWGIVGSTLTLVATVLLMLDVIKIVTPAYFIMNTPTALCELCLAVFLIRRGFNPVARHAPGQPGRSR
jgi:hypothetical protein